MLNRKVIRASSVRFEESPEKLKEINDNLNKALSEERALRQTDSKAIKELQDKISAKEAEEAEAQRKLDAKKIKEKEAYDEAEKKWEEERKGYLDKIGQLEPIAKGWQDTQEKTLTELKGKVPEGKKEFVEKLILGKTVEEQIALLPEIMTTFTPEKVGGAPTDNQKGGIPDKKVEEQTTVAGKLGAIFGQRV